MKAWQCFLSSADRLASLHASICRSLVSEDGDRVRTWQKDTFHKKLFGGFKESQDIETGFIRAQKPWAKRLKKVWIFSYLEARFCGLFFFHQIVLMIKSCSLKHWYNDESRLHFWMTCKMPVHLLKSNGNLIYKFFCPFRNKIRNQKGKKMSF